MSIPIFAGEVYSIYEDFRVLGHEFVDNNLFLKLDHEGDITHSINISVNKVLIGNQIIFQYLLFNNLLDVKIPSSIDATNKLLKLQEKISLLEEVYSTQAAIIIRLSLKL